MIELLWHYFCKEGSVGLNLDENKLLFDVVFKYIDKSGRFYHQNHVPHTMIPPNQKSDSVIFLHLY